MLTSALWYLDIFGLIGCDAILFTLTTTMDGVQSGIIESYLLRALLPTVLLSAALMLILYLPRFQQWLKHLLCIVLCLIMAVSAMFAVELPQYLLGMVQKTDLYDVEYIDPAKVAVTFPQKKRNLVYIYLESMENAFFSVEQGGIHDACRMPELYALAESNLNFSQNDGIGGGLALRGATWTMGAMIAHTAGIPQRVTPGTSNASHMPGATALADILHENGYAQALMVGSDAAYGRRAAYYQQHQTDRVYDLFTARSEGVIPENYRVWWGMEDEKLYGYAKEKIAELAAGDQPFAFTLLTVDTHHVDGYHCDLCGSDYAEPYDNVYACASRQAADFVSWLQAQPFYENTTIVLTGDHPSMDAGYFRRNAEGSYTRRVYNCFINAATAPVAAKGRDFSTFDMFPTTLAALGCTIDGNRLGLGVNLFSDEKTLVERYGADYLNAEILKSSHKYTNFQK